MGDKHTTEFDDIEQRGALCLDCNHRAIWHHDERGCQYLGNGRDRCPCAISSDAVIAHLIAHNLRGYAERERPRILVEGVPQALRVAAMLPAATLGDAWDAADFSLGIKPPWSYLRRFLNALADATDKSELSTSPGETA